MTIVNCAHRGASGYEKENTMKAFRLAAELGADSIETDIQMSSDGVPVLIHDETVNRTTLSSGPVASHSAAELRRLGVPLLEELLELAASCSIALNLELKNSIVPYPGMEQKVLELVDSHKLKDRVIYSSFNHHSMVHCRELDSAVKTGLLSFSTLYHPAKYCLEAGAAAYHPHFKTLTPGTVQECRSAGVLIHPYTANSEEEILFLREMNVDMIISNFPDRVARLLNH